MSSGKNIINEDDLFNFPVDDDLFNFPLIDDDKFLPIDDGRHQLLSNLISTFSPPLTSHQLPKINEEVQEQDQEEASYRFNILALQIGPWKKESEVDGELVVEISFNDQMLAWEAFNGPINKVRIEFNWSDIASMDPIPSEENPLHLDIQLKNSPMFFREDTSTPMMPTIWKGVADFTTNKAASSLCSTHRLTFRSNSEKDYDQIMTADPKRNLDQQVSKDENNLCLQDSQQLGADNPSPSGEKGPPHYYDLIGQVQLFNSYKGTEPMSLANVLPVSSTSAFASPTYTVGHPQINIYTGAAPYHQPVDHYSWQQQCNNIYEGAAYCQPTDNYHNQQQQIYGYESAVCPPSTDNFHNNQQQIYGYGGAAHPPPTDNFHNNQQQIYGYGVAVHPPPTDNFHNNQQQIYGYGGAVRHQQQMLNDQHYLNAFENVVHNQHSHLQQISGFEGAVHNQPANDFHSHQQPVSEYQNVHYLQPTGDCHSHQQHVNVYDGAFDHHQQMDHCSSQQNKRSEKGKSPMP